MKKIIIIGAGFGGLATAARLAHRGHEVTVLEKNGYVGGRNRRTWVKDCRFDVGPTLLMMLDPFRKLFEDIGEDFNEAIPHQLCDPSYRVFWRDGSRLDATTDVPVMVERLRALVGDREADAYPAFLKRLQDLYEDAIPNFVRKNYRAPGDVVAVPQLRRVLKHGMLSNLAKQVSKTFHDPRTQMLFTFQSMYLGLSPFDAPFVYSTLAYMEYGEGIFYPEGGLGKMSETIAEAATRRGATIRLNSPVASVDGTRVRLESGEELKADAVIINADLPYAKEKLEEVPSRELRNSCSAHLMYIEYNGELPNLEHHNVFFGEHFKQNLDSLFHDLAIPSDPAFYVCVSSKSDPTAAPAGKSNLFILIPVPNLDYARKGSEIAAMEQTILTRLSCEADLDLDRIGAVERRGPAEWKSELNLQDGAAFGIRADLFQSAFMRPNNRSSQKGVYYVGASTTPGNGLPMVLISAELVEDQLLYDGVI